MDKGIVFYDIFIYIIFAAMMMLIFFVLIKHMIPKPSCLNIALGLSEVAMTNNVGHSNWGFAYYNPKKKRVEAAKIKIDNILVQVPFNQVKYVRVEDLTGNVLLETSSNFNCKNSMVYLPRYGVNYVDEKPIKVIFGVCCPK